MQRYILKLLPVLCLGALAWPGGAASDAPAGPLSVRELMESVITPATDTLWGVDNPQADEDWRELENAAITTIAAATLVARGGAGPDDGARASSPEWRAFNDLMTRAAADALAAVRARDLDALLAANDALYPPCEGCHVAFNPGVDAEP